jgi:hypothetical protein
LALSPAAIAKAVTIAVGVDVDSRYAENMMKPSESGGLHLSTIRRRPPSS